MAPSAPGVTSVSGKKLPSKNLFQRFFFETRDYYYARIWLCKSTGHGDDYEKIGDEPIGIVKMGGKLREKASNRRVEAWVKHNGAWISSDLRNEVFVRAFTISETEYETDLAFDLFPTLDYTFTCPFNLWIKKKESKQKIIKWNILSATIISLPFSCAGSFLTETHGDIWSVMTVILFFHIVIATGFILTKYD